MILTNQQVEGLRIGVVSRITTPDFELISNLLDTIADLTRQHDTAHAVAIQAVANFIEEASKDGYEKIMSWGQIKSGILALAPAASQRLYDLRIAEAVRDALEPYKQDFQHIAEYWNGSDNNMAVSDALEEMRTTAETAMERLASASAEVERLKAEHL